MGHLPPFPWIHLLETRILSSAVAALCWLVYDTLIHLDAEVEHVWKQHFTWTNAAYFFVRYGTIAHMGAMTYVITSWGGGLSEAACLGWMFWQVIFPVFLNSVVEFIMMMRLRAMYFNNKIVLVTMYTAWVLDQLVTAAAAGLSLVLGGKGTGTCTVVTGPIIGLPYWVAPILFQTFLFALTIVKLRERIRAQFVGRTIMDVFIRDGMWAFTMIFGMQILNLLLNSLIHNSDWSAQAAQYNMSGLKGALFKTLDNVNFPAIASYCWACSVMSFAVSHVLLNLRSVVASTHTSLPTAISTVRFNTESTSPSSENYSSFGPRQ